MEDNRIDHKRWATGFAKNPTSRINCSDFRLFPQFRLVGWTTSVTGPLFHFVFKNQSPEFGAIVAFALGIARTSSKKTAKKRKISVRMKKKMNSKKVINQSITGHSCNIGSSLAESYTLWIRTKNRLNKWMKRENNNGIVNSRSLALASIEFDGREHNGRFGVPQCRAHWPSQLLGALYLNQSIHFIYGFDWYITIEPIVDFRALHCIRSIFFISILLFSLHLASNFSEITSFSRSLWWLRATFFSSSIFSLLSALLLLVRAPFWSHIPRMGCSKCWATIRSVRFTIQRRCSR